MLTLCRIILAKEDDDDDKPSGLYDNIVCECVSSVWEYASFYFYFKKQAF